MMIPPEQGRIPWWRLLWSLLGSLIVGFVGLVAVMADMNHAGPTQIMLQLIGLPFVRPTYYLAGVTDGRAVAVAIVASVLLWWFIIFRLLMRRYQRQLKGRAA